MKKLLIAALFFLVTSFVLTVPSVSANGKNVKTKPQVVKVRTQFLKKQNIVNIWFSKLHDAETIQYTLSYKADGVGQGVSGTISDSTFKGKSKIHRKIQLATCSSKTCVDHKNITDLKLEVVVTYEDGHKTTKTYNP
jgi:hypothetical protein